MINDLLGLKTYTKKRLGKWHNFTFGNRVNVLLAILLRGFDRLFYNVYRSR